jgi:hypothetical protein
MAAPYEPEPVVTCTLGWLSSGLVVASGTRAREAGRSTAVVLVVALLGAPAQAVAAGERSMGSVEAGLQAAPQPDASALLRSADEALERGDHAAAAEGFAGSYRALSIEQRRGPVGNRTIALAYDAYREAWHRGRDAAPLRAARELLAEHVAALEPVGRPAAVQEARHKLGWIEHLLELEDASARVPEAAACPEPTPQEAPVCPSVEPEAANPAGPTHGDAPARRRDAVGVALVAAGAVTLAGGVGLLVGGSRVLPTAREQIESTGRNPDDPVPQDEAYLQVHEERGRNLMIAGGVVAGVGAAAATWGIVRLVQRREGGGRARERAVAVGLSPRGILLRGRF